MKILCIIALVLGISVGPLESEAAKRLTSKQAKAKCLKQDPELAGSELKKCIKKNRNVKSTKKTRAY